MKMALGYELPFILSVITVIVKSNGAIRLAEILRHQSSYGSNIASLSGGLAFLAAVFCMQAKLCFVPFDASEAEQELMAGALIEYSGWTLAIFKLTKAVLLYVMPVFLVTMFLGKDTGILFLTAKYVLLLVIIILLKNTNPRMRPDQALRFFWGPVTATAAISVILALLGF
jgi:NADH-quinone oxidoreductase subunit H